MDKEIAERIAMALEGIEAELKTGNQELARIAAGVEKMWAEPNFAPMGIAVVDKDSPEARRAQLQAGTLGRRPPG